MGIRPSHYIISVRKELVKIDKYLLEICHDRQVLIGDLCWELGRVDTGTSENILAVPRSGSCFNTNPNIALISSA